MIVPSVSSIAKLTVAVLPSVSTVVVDAWVMVVVSLISGHRVVIQLLK
jgi:hypothetical protein